MTERKAPLVLIVDDDLTIREVLSHLLARAGLKTACASDGAEGLSLARSLQPDLVLLDVNLPDTDGFTICRELQNGASTPHAPVLFISANEGISYKLQGFEAGAVDYITKPLEEQEVAARVRTHLRLKEAYDNLAKLQAERIERLEATQQTLMPSPADFPDAQFAVSMRQIHGAGGDFYDVIPVADGLVDYVVADGSGHGVEVAFWTAALKALLHEYASPLNTPADILYGINRTLCRILPEGLYFTMIYARLNRHSGLLTLTNAGHPPSLCLRNAWPCDVARQTGDLVGVFSDAAYETIQRVLSPGDRFFLYTDGLVEIQGSREEGIASLRRLCEQHRALSLQSQIETMGADFVTRKGLRDDIVLLGVEA